MLENPHVTQSVAQATAVIRLTIPKEEIRKVMEPAMNEVMSTLAAQNITVAGPMFSHHFRMDPAVFDFEVGVPITKPVSPSGRVMMSQLPSAKVARTVYRGPYEGLGPAWEEFMAWIAAEGHEPGPDLWEIYMSGPESDPDPTTYRTELNRPLGG
jgi:effector-binding domain-containing protein